MRPSTSGVADCHTRAVVMLVTVSQAPPEALAPAAPNSKPAAATREMTRRIATTHAVVSASADSRTHPANVQWAQQVRIQVREPPLDLRGAPLAQTGNTLGPNWTEPNARCPGALRVAARRAANGRPDPGLRLSAGERQLVGIARVALADPAVIVLDEATSSLDPATETAVERALAAVAVGRTVVTIAHRLSTAERADRVVVMEHGRAVEVASHEELVEQGERYAKLWASWQAGLELTA